MAPDICAIAGGATKTVSVIGGLMQPFPLTIRVYIPEFTGEAFVIIGFWSVEENPFGPTQK